MSADIDVWPANDAIHTPKRSVKEKSFAAHVLLFPHPIYMGRHNLNDEQQLKPRISESRISESRISESKRFPNDDGTK